MTIPEHENKNSHEQPSIEKLSISGNKEEEKKEKLAIKHGEHQISCFEVPETSKIWFDGKIQFKKEKFVD
jgi:hypothetical protein